MKQADFYLLSVDKPAARWKLACQLTEKAYLEGRRVFIYCHNQDDAYHIDEYLWSFRPQSFIPHNLQGEGPLPPPAVQIGFGPEPRGFNDILLNLSPTIPDFFQRFEKIITVVNGNEQDKQYARDHYRFYKKQGFHPIAHPFEEEHHES
jgi:DNA polymerase-3 subunit chi